MSSIVLRIVLLGCLCLIILPSQAGAEFSPSSSIEILGGNPSDMAFSSGNISWPAPASPAIMGGYTVRGNAWIDSIGWIIFDHGVTGRSPMLDSACLVNTSIATCTLVGFAWSPQAGWIRFGQNNGSNDDVIYTKNTGELRGYAWNNNIGWIRIDARLWTTPIIIDTNNGNPIESINAFDYYTFATGSTRLPINVPDFVENAENPITVNVCLAGSSCLTYIYNTSLSAFPGVDLSIAGSYTYTITDPFGSTTTGNITVYPARPSVENSIEATGRINSLGCSGNTVMPYCPDGARRTSYSAGELGNPSGTLTPKKADNVESFEGNISLRDRYGNPIISVPSIGRSVNSTITMTGYLMTNSLSNTTKFYKSNDLIGQSNPALRLAGGVAIDGNNLDNRIELLDDTLFRIRSIAPTQAGYPYVRNNITRIESVISTVTGPEGGTIDISSKFNRSALPFLPLYRVVSVAGLDGVQMLRESTITGSIVREDPNNKASNAVVIYGLSIGTLVGDVRNVASTFQDFIDNTEDCFAFLGGSSSANYTGYCQRSIEAIGENASTIAKRLEGTVIHSFRTTPRTRVTVDIEQRFLYDTIMSYNIESQGISHEIIFESLTGATTGTGKVFTSTVKIIGQSSGDTVFQTTNEIFKFKNVTLSRAEILNEIRKNVALLTRNVTFTGNKYSGSNIVVYRGDQTLDTAKLGELNQKSSIVVYGNISLTNDYSYSDSDVNPRAIIALKDAQGNGGNIYLSSGIQRIDSSIIAEGSLISGTPTAFYSDAPDAIDTLNSQLYIFGTVISNNTIGGAARPQNPVCPRFIINCTLQEALRYDFEHFRYFRDINPVNEAPLDRLAENLSDIDKKASVIIEYDSRIITDPPAGLEFIR